MPRKILIGTGTNGSYADKNFYLSDHDFDRGLYLVGQPDTGKTTLMENCGRQQAEDQNFAVIEPKADLSARVLDHIPEARIERTVNMNLEDQDNVVPFNMLHGFRGPDYRDERPLIAASIMDAFKKLWPNSWSESQMETYWTYCVLALLEYPDATVLHIEPFFKDKDFRQGVERFITNPIVLRFWEQYDGLKWHEQKDIAKSTINRISQLYANERLASILCAPRNTFDFEDLITNGGILLVNLAANRIGERAASMIGSLILSRIHTLANRRAAHENPQPFTLYVDEFHEYVSEGFAATLSQSRQSRLRFVLAHQYIGQLSPAIRSAIFGSIGTMAVFRVGESDAHILNNEVSGPQHHDLNELPQGHIHIKLLEDGKPASFQAETFDRPKPMHDLADFIRTYSQQQFSIPRATIDHHIARWCAPNKDVNIASDE